MQNPQPSVISCKPVNWALGSKPGGRGGRNSPATSDQSSCGPARRNYHPAR